MLSHRSVFVEEQLEGLGAVRLSDHEECFEKAIGAESDVCDEATGVSQPVHCQRNLLGRRFGIDRTAGRRLSSGVLGRRCSCRRRLSGRVLH